MDRGDDTLNDDDSDETDVQVLIGDDILEQPTENSARQVARAILLDDSAISASDSDEINKAFIQEELAKLLPTYGRESTLESFNRLTNDAAWFPFRSPDSSTPESDIDREEAYLFDKLVTDHGFLRDAKSGPKAYARFALAWNNEVARRFKQWSEGDDSIIQVRRKSVIQLQKHYDKRQEYLSLQASAPNENDDERQRLRRAFRDTRQQLPAQPQPERMLPMVYM